MDHEFHIINNVKDKITPFQGEYSTLFVRCAMSDGEVSNVGSILQLIELLLSPKA